jgi:hypothetical protein
MRAPPESRSLPQATRPRWSNSESNRESTHPRASAHPARCAFSLGPAVDPRLLQPCSGSASESVQGSAQCRATPIRHGARCLESSVDSQPSSPAGRPFPGRRHAAGRSRVPPAHPLPRVSASLGAPASRPLPRALPLPTAASARWASQITCTPLARRKNQRQAALPPSGRLHPAPDCKLANHLLQL